MAVDDLSGSAICRSFLNPERELHRGMTWDAFWRSMSPYERSEWVQAAGRLGVVPDGSFVPWEDLPPSWTLAPGAYCYRVLAQEGPEGVPGGQGGQLGPEGQPGSVFAQDDGIADLYRLPPSGIFAQIADLVRRAASAIVNAVRGAIEAARDLLRGLLDAIGALFGPASMWLLAIAGGLILVALVQRRRGRR